MMHVSLYAAAQWAVYILYNIIFLATFSQKDSWIWTILLLTCSVLMIVCEYKRTRRFNSPLLLWYCFWIIVITIGRMDLHLYTFGSTWGNSLLLCVMLSSAVFFVAYWIGELGKPYESIWANEELYIDGDKLLRALSILSIVAIGAYILNVAYTRTIPQLSRNVNVLRAGFVTTPFYKIVNGLRCIFMFVPIALKYGSQNELKRRVLFLSGVFFVLEMLSGWRGYTFQAIIMIISSMFLLVNIKERKEIQKNKRRMRLFAAFAVVFIVYISVTRAGVGGSLTSQLQYGISIIYLYIAPNFLNFQSAMSRIVPKGYPLYTTEAIWGLFIPETSMPGYENINQNIGAFNVSTYMLQPYADQGLFGVMLWTFIIAFFGAVAYKICFKKSSFVWVTILCSINVTIFTMHNGFFLRASSAVLWLIVGCFLQWYIRPNVAHKE